MPINNLSVGRDLSFALALPTGNIAINGVTDYEIKPMFTDLKHKGLDGNVLHAAIPDGWQVSLRVERADAQVDDYFAQLEAAYFAGTNIQGATLVETIQEVNGSTSQFRYTNVSLKYDAAGTYKGDSFVQIALTGSASRRIQVA